MKYFQRYLKITLAIFALLIAAFSAWYLLHKNPDKVIHKILKDPFFIFREIKVKSLIEEQEDAFLNHIAKEPPTWFLEQIKQDFSNISHLPITKKAIDETFATGNYLRIKIIDNKVYVPRSKLEGIDERDNEMVKTFLFLTKKVKLPDVDVLLSCEDILSKDMRSSKAPVFVFALNKNHSENRILIPDALTLINWKNLYFSILEINKEIPWANKINKAFWRGSSTGVIEGQNLTFENFHTYPRAKLVEYSNNHPDLLDAKFVSFTQVDENSKVLLEKKYKLAKKARINEHLKYKIQITIDGNTSTYLGYLWRLVSNCVTFKDDSQDIQWFYKILKPNVHYIPYKSDMSDLGEKIEWVKTHDTEAKKISENASKLVQENLKITDIYQYIFVLLQEYNKLQDFKPEPDNSLVEFK